VIYPGLLVTLPELELPTGAAAPVPPLEEPPDDAPEEPPDEPPELDVPPSAGVAGALATTRHFTSNEGGANKFWETSVSGSELTVRFGRIGTRGQVQSKTFPTPDAAHREQEKLIRSKLAKGYVERVG
jgi:predicted DNA-binding WGR domain protein